MGVFGKLLGRPAPVEGRITVANRPDRVQYLLTTWFFPSSAGAVAPDDASLDNPRRVEADVQPSSSLLSDQGYMFRAELPAGFWQVVVRAQPYRLEGERIVTDPRYARTHRPQTKAFQTVAGETRHLALKLQMEAAPVDKVAAPFRPPLPERAGESLWRRYQAAVELIRVDPGGAFAAFDALERAPERIDPETRSEMRMLAGIGRAVCVNARGERDAALRMLEEIGSPESIASRDVDGYTRWAYFGASAVVMGLADDGGAGMRARASSAVGALHRRFAATGTERDTAEALALATWTGCLGALLAGRSWNEMLAFGAEGKHIADTHRLAGIKWYSCCAVIEARLALGNEASAAAEADALRALMSGLAGTASGVETLLGRARAAGLSRAATFLRVRFGAD